MGLLDRVEQRLERAVNGAFARAFKSEVQPVEIASADPSGHGRPGRRPRPGPHDRAQPVHHRAAPTPTSSALRLRRGARGRADRRRPGARRVPALPARGPLQVSFASANDLETGVFRLRTSTARRPGVARRAPVRGHAAARPPVRRRACRGSGAAPRPAAPRARPRTMVAKATGRQAPVSPPAVRAGSTRPTALARRRRRACPLMGAMTVLGPRRLGRHHPRRPGHLAAAQRDPRDDRRAAPRRQHPRHGSTNGTFVNSERISSQRLFDGDRITVGGRLSSTEPVGGERHHE